MNNLNQLKVFITDDDVFSLNIYIKYLRNMNILDVTPFDNGHACLNSLSFKPDIVFLDHNIGLLDGLEVLKKIKRESPDVYVVMLSGQNELEVAVNCFRYGAFDYIIKGNIEEVRIKNTIYKILREKENKNKNNCFVRKWFT